MADDREQFDLVIVGMGSAGLVAAEFAATIGLRVAAVERGRFGGDCLWTGCVPSKALVAAARAAHTMRHADRWGLPAYEPDIDLAAVFGRIRAVRAEIAASDDDPARFAEMGVTVVTGHARLTAPDEVTVDEGRRLGARMILLCTGSRPVAPAIPGLDAAGFLTSETIWDVDSPPRSLVMIGGGPVVAEVAQAMARLGVEVTVFAEDATLLTGEEPELVARLTAVLARDGVRLHTGARVTGVVREAGGVRVDAVVGGDAVPEAERAAGDAFAPEGERVVSARAGSGDPARRLGGGRGGSGGGGGEAIHAVAEAVFVAVGRTPNADDLGLDDVGVERNADGVVVVDDRGRTSVRSIYVAGDLAGRHLFTHSAGHEAVRAVRDAFFPGIGKVPDLVPWCTFTDPELAHVGLTVGAAEARYGADVDLWRLDLTHNDRARTDGTTDGAIVIVTAKAKLVGAHVLAPAAGEIVHELALAIHHGLKISDIASLVHVYPTLATGIGQLAADAAYEKAQKLRWLVRRGR